MSYPSGVFVLCILRAAGEGEGNVDCDLEQNQKLGSVNVEKVVASHEVSRVDDTRSIDRAGE